MTLEDLIIQAGGLREAASVVRVDVSRRIKNPRSTVAVSYTHLDVYKRQISHEVSLQSDSVEFNPVRLDEVNERLNLIYSLQQKHRAQTLGELIALTDEYRSKLSDITSYDERIAELTARKEEQYKQVKQQAEVSVSYTHL